MTEKEKQLLLIDIYGRIQYGVKIATAHYQYGDISTPTGVVGDKCYFGYNPRYDGDCPIEDIKPYLRSLSSMTEDEREEFREVGGVMSYNPQNNHYAISAFTPEAYDWLNENKFDYRGLIPKGLALEAKEGMYDRN